MLDENIVKHDTFRYIRETVLLHKKVLSFGDDFLLLLLTFKDRSNLYDV